MSALETLVRPAQLVDIRPSYFAVPREIVTGPIVSDAVTWGKAGASVFDTRNAHLTWISKSNEQNAREERRVFDTVKIKNPDDDSQHIIVESLTEYQARNQIDKSRVILRYGQQENGSGADGNIEVLSRGNVRTTPTPE